MVEFFDNKDYVQKVEFIAEDNSATIKLVPRTSLRVGDIFRDGNATFQLTAQGEYFYNKPIKYLIED